MKRRLHAATILLALGLAAWPAAQSKPPIARADYAQWETIALAGDRTFSPDAAWIAWTVNRRSGENELRFRRMADGEEKTVAFGSGHQFGADSRWAAYAIGHSEAEQERMRTARQPIQNSLGLLNLQSGETTTVNGIQAFSFSGDGRFLAMRRYAPPAPAGNTASGGTGAPPAAPGGGRGGGPAAGDAPPPGVTVIVRDLQSGRDTTFGNVSEFAWQDDERGHLLALTINADGMSGNGVHLFNPSTTVLRVLDSSATHYASLAWREDSTDLAVLRARTNDRREGPTQDVIAWRGLGAGEGTRVEFDPTSTGALPAGMRTVTYRRPAWSADGRVLFVGVAEWAERPAGSGSGRGAAGREGRGAGDGGDAGRGGAPPAAGGGPGRQGGGPAGRGSAPARDEPAAVDIWHWKDASVMARQKLTATADRRRSLLAALHLDEHRLVPLQQSALETVTPVDNAAFAYVEDGTPYAMDRSIGRPAADLSLVDLTTGRRTPLKTGVSDFTAQTSPAGRYLLFVEGGHYVAVNLATKAAVNLTRSVRTSFVDTESDSTGPVKPMFGVGGWTADDAALLLYDKHDIWHVNPDGQGATRLTDGAAEGVRHRLVRLDPTVQAVGETSYVSLFGLRSKKSGYGRLRLPAGAGSGTAARVERLLWRDEAVGTLVKARGADVYAYIAQRHDDSPDVFVTDGSLAAGRQITTTNPFQARFAWSRSEIVEYRSATGQPLQGALYYPAGYEPGRTYPMIVYLYETLSDGVHRYVAPSDREYYNTTVFTSQGYFVLQPDIVFRPREPGVSVVECVTPAVKRVVDLGLADAKRVGVIGHSWGGFDTAYLATHTQGVFAAAVAGAAITNLVSNYGNHHWSSGIAETDHIETGQQRMQVPLYEDLPAYIRNSAVFNVHRMTVPLMLMTGDDDGTVYWHQAVEMYNIARRAKKNVVMLVYNGEDHGLRQARNQIDYQQRILAWFGHYLKGDPAAPWILEGRPFLDRDRAR